MADLTGQTLGQYRLGALIGRGGMASVYRARQESMDRDVAIKIMAMELTSNAEFVARFEREARVIARLQHPHILPVIDFGREPYVYLVMRLVDGGALSDRLQETTLNIQQANQFLAQIASALEYAHQRGIVHRDLKPNNVLLDDQDNCYLTDFGIAKMLAGTTTGAHLTSTGSIMGTPSYMAPEQWRSDPVDGRTDIYALGIIAYEMLMGTLPFQAETPFAMMYKHFDELPPLPRAINPDLPEPLEQVVLRALAKNPDDRYPSARQLADDFNRAVNLMPPDVLHRKLPRATVEQLVAATPSRQSRPSVPVGGTPPSQSRPAMPSPAYTQTRPAAQTAPRRGGRGLLVGGALVIVALIAAAVVAVLALGGGGDEKQATGTPAAAVSGGEVTPTPKSGVIFVVTPVPATATPRSALLPGLTPSTATFTPVSPTPQPSATPSPEPSATSTPQPTVTPLPTTAVPSATSTASFTPSTTPDLQASAEALLAIRLTQTAEGWTDTPTPDIEKTVMAAMTGTASAWTKTPTPTPTYTPTPIPTLPPPPTATRTLIPTLPLLIPTRLPSSTPYCAAALPTRMRVGSGGRTTLQPPSPTRVRQVPGLNSTVVRSIPAGQTFSVIEGPECADGVQWWRIDVYDNNGRWSGWIGEGQSGTYWIEPFETGPIDCPGAPAPRMSPGMTGRVTLDPYSPNNIRSQPYKASTRLGEVQPGGTYEVLSGPVCDTTTHYRYWLVRTSSRLEGWMAEGVPGQYWMEPWS